MSFILDALKKSQADRDANKDAGKGAAPAEVADGEEPDNKARLKRLGIIGGVGLLAIALLLGGLKFFLGGEPPPKVAEQTQKAAAKTGEDGATPPTESKAKPAEAAATPETPEQTPKKTTAEPAEPPAGPDPMRPPTLVSMVTMMPSMAADAPEPEAEPIPEPEPEPAAAPEEVPVAEATPARKPEAPLRLDPTTPDVAASPVGDLEQARRFEAAGRFDQAAAAYSRAIRGNPDAATAYLGRAWSYLELGRLDQAIGDFTRALNRSPRLGDGFLGRAWAYERKGNLSLAAGDYSELLRLDPANAGAALSRGIIAFQERNFTAAGRDFQRALEAHDPTLSPYALIWRYVSALRAGKNAADSLGLNAAGIDLTAWPGVLAAHFLGQVSEDRVMAVVEEAATRPERLKRACVVQFFLGEVALADGRTDRAREKFQAAVDTGITGYRQYWVAKAELGALEKGR